MIRVSIFAMLRGLTVISGNLLAEARAVCHLSRTEFGALTGTGTATGSTGHRVSSQGRSCMPPGPCPALITAPFDLKINLSLLVRLIYAHKL